MSAPQTRPAPQLAFPEFIALMAWLMALTALSIDIMLPALPAIGAALGATSDNERQLVVTCYLGGLAAGQLLWGPLSDRIGRRAPLLIGLGVYVAGALAALAAPSLGAMLAARVLQGFGGAAARTIGTAVIRDAYSGRGMARVMSFVMTVFILVPVLAPAIGQGLMKFFTWQACFVALLGAGGLAFAWVALRLPETRGSGQDGAVEGRLARGLGLSHGLKLVLGSRVTVGYAIASGFTFSCLVSYIASAQQIFVDAYGLGDRFPLAFGGVAGTMALASMTNARLVQRLGMRRLAHQAMVAFVGVSAVLLVACLLVKPPFLVLGALLGGCFFLFGITMPNLTAIALQPVGQAAGLASSLVGAYTTAAGVLLGGAVGQSFDGSALPLAVGFVGLGCAAFAAVVWVEGRAGLFMGE